MSRQYFTAIENLAVRLEMEKGVDLCVRSGMGMTVVGMAGGTMPKYGVRISRG